MTPRASSPTGLPRVPVASLADTARTLGAVVVPLAARGAIVRRPRMVALAQRLDADRRAVRTLQRLRGRYGPGPVQLKVPGRRFTFLLEPEQVHRVLEESPTPFATATREKRAALAHFQPQGLLASSVRDRPARRELNEAVLDTGLPLHRLAGTISRVVEQESADLLGDVESAGVLDWDRFAVTWWRVVRRVVLGDSARDDEATTDLLLRQRRDANWTYLKARRRHRTRELSRRLQEHVDRAEAGSLAELLARTPARPGAAPHQQMPQWLFAFDATAWATFRALALLSAHPDAADRARAEVAGSPDLPFLRATVLESLRLWPTTPAILRDTTAETVWDGRVLPARSGVVLYAPFFHRDDSRVPEADQFTPELWLRERTADDWPLVPFSGGPAMCPGRNIALLTASVMLGRLLTGPGLALERQVLDAVRPLPGTLSPFHLRFEAVTPR